MGSDRSPWGKRLWYHALGVAWSAKLLARHVRQVDAESAFVTGLLHDVGLQLLVVLHEREANEMLEARGCLDNGSTDDERAHFGTDHTELGAAALRRWSLPEGLVEAVAVHHQPLGLSRTARPRDVALLQVADAIAMAIPTATTADDIVRVAMMHPAAPVLRAVRGAYGAVGEMLIQHWDSLADF